MDLKQKTISGIKWMVVAGMGQRIISFGVTIILARLLGPSDFGLFALSLIVVSSFDLFKSLGVDSALVQRKDDLDKAADTAFFIIPTLGITLYVLLFTTAPLIAGMMNKPELISILRALGLIFVFSCFARVPSVLMEKDVHFNKISLIDIIGSTTFSFVALFCALLGLRVWSLVVAYLVKTFIYMLLVWRFAQWKPHFRFDKVIALQMVHYGKFLLMGSIVWFLRTNLSNFLVGGVLGTAALGFFAVALNISNFTTDYFGGQVYRVIFPTFAKLQNNPEQLKRAALKVSKYASIFIIPFGIGVFFLGSDFLRCAYGTKWLAAAPVLKILAWSGIWSVLPLAFGALFLAIGRPRIHFWSTFLQVVAFFIFVVPVAKTYGLVGVGWVVMISSFMGLIYMSWWGIRLLHITRAELIECLKPSLLSSAMMTIGIVFSKLIFQNTFFPHPVYGFLIVMTVATGAYVVSLLRIERNVMHEIRGVFSA